jgi:outer membrane protein assembly factor BamB
VNRLCNRQPSQSFYFVSMKAALALALILSTSLSYAEWTRFRGPNGSGVAEGSKLPLTWSATENLRWKADLPGPGSSSPIIVGDKILLTSWSGYGGSQGDDMQKLRRHVVCVAKADGKVLWSKEVPAVQPEDEAGNMLMEHGYASSTPVSDGKNVYVFFGKTGVLAFDLDGKQLWQTSVGTGSNDRRWGSAASPILHGGNLIVNAYDESGALYALDPATGKEVWKAPAEGVQLAYGTPSVIGKGEDEALVLAVPQEVWGFNPSTGKLRWFLTHDLPGNVSPGVIEGDGACYLFGGYPRTGSVAFTPGGKDDITKSGTLWAKNDSTYVPTPIFHEGHLYVINDNGFALCMNAKTGETVFKERVMESGGGGGRRGMGKPFYGSPILADGKLYCVSRKNGSFVIEAKPSYKLLAQNVISTDDSQWNGSPAVDGNRMYLRSDKALYCIGAE